MKYSYPPLVFALALAVLAAAAAAQPEPVMGDPAMGDPALAEALSSVSPKGEVEGVDCDDGDPQTYPGAAEACDGNDNDCD